MGTEKPAKLGYATPGAGQTQQPALRWWVVALAVVAGIAAVYMFAIWSGPHTANPRQMCASNLGHIGRACLSYTESHRGNFPASLDILTEGGQRAYAQSKQLICPVCRRAYIYIPGHTTADDPTCVLVYEPLSNHGGSGANVLRLDGSVKWMKPADYQKLMAQQTPPTTTRPAPASAPNSEPAISQ